MEFMRARDMNRRALLRSSVCVVVCAIASVSSQWVDKELMAEYRASSIASICATAAATEYSVNSTDSSPTVTNTTTEGSAVTTPATEYLDTFGVANYDPYIKPTDELDVAESLEIGYMADDSITGAASLMFSDDKVSGVYCGGALVATNMVVTVARCLFRNATDMYKYVYVEEGWRDRIAAFADPNRWYDTLNVAIVHPLFRATDRYMKFNIAKIITPDTISRYSVINLHQNDYPPSNSLVLVGYGHDRDARPKRYLRYMDVELVHNATCVSVFGPLVCASDIIVTRGKYPIVDGTICQVERGAPLIQRRFLFGPKLVGLASHSSFVNCQIGNLDAHVYLSEFYNWMFA